MTLIKLTFGVAVAVPAPAFPETQDSPDVGRVVVSLDMHATHSEFVPSAEALLLSLLNSCRVAHHVAPLALSGSLRYAARQHSRAMALQGFAGHGSPSGQSFLDRLSSVVPPRTFVGENVTIARTPEQANSAFMASPGHLENMLRPEFHMVGIGVASAGRYG